MSSDPYAELVDEFRLLLGEIGERVGENLSSVQIARSRSKYGYLSAPLHDVARRHSDIENVIKSVAERFVKRLIESVSYVNGFLNVDVNIRSYGELVLKSVLTHGDRYGYSERCPKGKYIIEHTSANPVHPLHIGHARNAVIGDTLARLLRFCGCDVRTHFYLNDCGDQTAYALIGYLSVKDCVAKRIEEGFKPDHVIGIVYSTTYVIAEIKRLTQELRGETNEERAREIIRERDEWLIVLDDLRRKDEEIVTRLIERLGGHASLHDEVRRISRMYELGDKDVRAAGREMIGLVIKGFRETLSKLGISFDSWDWESEITVDSGSVRQILSKLLHVARDYVEVSENVITFRADRYAEDLELWDELRLPKYIPKAVLTRADGTTLYLTRDVAYALWCFERFRPDMLIRVIAVEQMHPQAQLRILLHALGYREIARKVIHYAYEMVNVPGFKMSARRGRYVTIDELIDEAKRRAAELVKPRLSPDLAESVSECVAVGAIRYAMLSVSPSKTMTFTWDRVINLRQNSGPFIQYTYVRAYNIIERSGAAGAVNFVVPESVSSEERELILLLGELPSVISRSASSLNIDPLIEYTNKLSLAFNSFYEKHPVTTAEEPYRSFRLALVMSVEIALKNIMNILGIPILKRM